MAASVIVICPCCASVQEAADDPGTERTFDCEHCGQQWTMRVDGKRHAEHALL